MIPQFAYARARSIDEAIALLGKPGTRPAAGATDLIGCLRDGVFTATSVVALGSVDALKGITETADGGLRIGALTTLTTIAKHALVAGRYPALAQAAASVASPQLRNQGTLGGNLCQRPRCWFFRGGYDCARKGGDTCYAMQGDNRYHCVFGGSTCLIVHPSDTATALTALEAMVSIAGPKGERTVPIQQFFVLPERDMTHENVLAAGEIVTTITLPAPRSGMVSLYRKARARAAWDFALAACAVAITLEQGKVKDARIVLGGAAPIPWRVEGAERMLVGKRLDEPTRARVAAAALNGATPLEHNAYKVAMLRGVVSDALGSIG
jgi:xanthine dehydrogenase YagS FAD-binding subunit